MSLQTKKSLKENESQFMEFFKRHNDVMSEKMKRCNEWKNSDPPSSYKSNTPKEQLVLEHVIQFKKQFQQHIGENRELFLYPKNQCGVYKFICTTIRPTKLGFLQLYDYKSCAERLSKFIQYEELDFPDQFPKCIPSPANVAKWQKGDCFDLSILLTSLLIGVGYDAYCVYGIAPKQITTKNEALLQCPFLNQIRQNPEQVKEKMENDKKKQQNDNKNDELWVPKILESQFDKKVVNQEKQQKQELARKALTIDDDQPDQLAPDLYIGRRLHCWVLVKKGKRGVKQDIFIEPSTGRQYPIKNSPYLLVDAIFNNTNFFIHMQPKHKVDQIKFQLYETITWQYVMLHDELFRNTGQQQVQDLEDNSMNKLSDEEEKLKYLAQTLDMPPPWSPKIYIQKDRFLMGTPLGQTTTFFIKVKVDKYSQYSQPDGLVLKYTLYEDYKKLKIKQIGYFYKNRSDKLQRKYRYPFEFKTVEKYGPGSKPQWKQVIEIDRRMRIITYYPNRNQDGLTKRVEKIGEKTIEFYDNRDDYIISRSVTFTRAKPDQLNTTKTYYYDNSHVGRVKIQKMSMRFAKRKDVKASEQIAKMTVDFLKEKVLVFYHMNQGEIEPKKIQYPRDQILGIGKLDSSNDKKNDDPIVQQQNQKLLDKDKQCYQAIKNNDSSAAEQYKSMRNGVLTIEKTLYQKAREKFKESKNKVEQNIAEQDANDYLRPFLQKRKLSLSEPLSFQMATEIRNEVMKKMKQRIIARAKIIQERLQKQQDYLKTLDQQYQKKQDEKNERQRNEVNFKIDILQSRSSRFEAMALQKFQQMDQKLNSDPRLAVLKQQRK